MFEYFSDMAHLTYLSVDLVNSYRSSVGKELWEYAMYITFNSNRYQPIALLETMCQMSPVAHL
jgi:hypothetical protein